MSFDVDKLIESGQVMMICVDPEGKVRPQIHSRCNSSIHRRSYWLTRDAVKDLLIVAYNEGRKYKPMKGEIMNSVENMAMSEPEVRQVLGVEIGPFRLEVVKDFDRNLLTGSAYP